LHLLKSAPVDLVTEQKLERRERILEGARELLARRGYAGLTMRDLAAHCRVSVPTLYNQFGSKDALLAAAAQAHQARLLGAKSRRWRGHRRLIGVMGLCADEMARLPAYHRALIGSLMGEATPVLANMAAELSSELEQALDEMRSSKQLAIWADPRVLARQIVGASVSAAIGWSMGALDDDQLRVTIVHAAAQMTLGAARGSARTALEREARRAQASIAADLPGHAGAVEA